MSIPALKQFAGTTANFQDASANNQASWTFGAVSSASGANLLLQGNGATTPNKTIRVINGLFQIINHGYTIGILGLTDAGALSCASTFQPGTGTATAPPILIPPGVLLTTPQNGALETDPAGNISYTFGGARRAVAFQDQLAAGGGGAGVTSVNFGAAPGASDATVAVAATSILGTSYIDARIVAIATADHSADEHWAEEIDICAGNLVAGVGFTIYARTRNRPLYGLYSVAWQWR